MNPNVSIIIPTYNRRLLIDTTIDNLLRQSLPPHEIIIIDDHSTDDTLNWLDHKYGNKLILLPNKDKGPGAARNTGLKIASGDYIKFFDSDDLMTQNTLEVQVNTLKETGKGLVTGPYFYASEVNGNWISKDNVILNYYNFPQHKPLTHWMIWGLFIPIPAMLFTHEFIQKTGFWPEEMITSEDWAYLWNIAMHEPFPAHTNECAFLYRLHTEQSTGANLNNTQRDKEKYFLLKQIFDLDIVKGHFSIFEKLLFQNKFYQMARLTPDPVFKRELFSISGNLPVQKLLWEYFRLKNKFGRIRTQTNWQSMHGPKSSSILLKDYLKNILSNEYQKTS